MTFLIDENLSFRLKRELADAFPSCRHVAEFRLLSSDDELVWERAREEGLTLLSKDNDLEAIVTRKGHPPRLVWIRLGNVSTNEIAKSLIAHAESVRRFINQRADGVMIIASHAPTPDTVT